MVEAEVHRVRKSLKQVVNDALRRGLTSAGAARAVKRYRVRPHQARLRPGIDRGRLNALADEQDDAGILRAVRGRKS
jgi:hypothetical protein